MAISERIEGTIENWTEKWKDRLKDWLADVLSFGIDVFMKVLGKSYAPKLKPFLDNLESQVEIPPEFKPLVDEIREPTGEAGAMLASQASGAIIGNTIGKVIDFLLRPFMQSLSLIPHFHLLHPFELITLFRRNKIAPDIFDLRMREHGIHPDRVNDLIELTSVRFPSEVASLAWIRDKAKYGWLWQDVRENGVDPERIAVLQELAHRIPEVQDVIRFAVREVYTPEIAEAFGQFEDYPNLAETDAGKAGIRPDDLRKFWAAHWDLPSATQGFEMYHRGIITFDQLAKLLRARDVMPFWRDKLTEIAWDLPNRIELRMMARYGLVDKAFLVDMLGKVGLAPEYRDVAADMMLVMGIRTDLATRYAKKWINADQLQAELVATGLSPQVQDRLYKWIVSNNQVARVEDELKLTKAEIVKGVKNGLITWDEGIELLIEKGYDEEEAMFVLAVNIEVAMGSPHNLGEFKRLTQLERLATGKKTDRPGDVIVEAEKELGKSFAAPPPLTDEERRIKIDNIRRRRRQQEITRDEEIIALRELGLTEDLAVAYADNDDLRLQGRA